jgi:hypothetical protein
MVHVWVIPPDEADADMFHTPRDPWAWGSAFWNVVARRLSAEGYEIDTIQRASGPPAADSLYLVMNVPQALRKRTTSSFSKRIRHTRRMVTWPYYALVPRLLAKGLGPRMALMLFEPACVIPDNFDPAIHARFGAVLTWSDDLIARGPPCYRFRFPYLVKSAPLPGLPFEERKLLAAFMANKTSTHPLELYSARRDVLAYMQAHAPVDFDLYGAKWSTAEACWRGYVDDKHAAYSRYRFGLCYENMRDTPGYVTEKIFDCLAAGSVPVYWGAPNIADYVDPDTFIDRRQFASIPDLIAYLRSVTQERWEAYREAGQRYLASGRLDEFGPERAADNLLPALQQLGQTGATRVRASGG